MTAQHGSRWALPTRTWTSCRSPCWTETSWLKIDKVFQAIKSYGDPFSGSNRTLTPRKTGAMCAIECARWDITGKVYGVPVWKLLGPKLRDRVPMYCDTAQQRSISAMQTAVDARLKLGFSWFKTDLQRTYLTSGTDCTLNNQDGYPYKCITVNPSGFDKWVPTGPGLGIKPNEAAIRAHLTGSYFAPLT